MHNSNCFSKLSEYGLKFLFKHEEQANRSEKVYKILAKEHNTQNAWFEAKDAIGDGEGFLNDVLIAKKFAENDYACSKKGMYLALQFRYVLLASSFKSLANSIPSELIVALAKYRYWTSTQCLAYIKQLRKLDRLKVLAQILPYYPKLLSEVLDSAESLDNTIEKAKILTEVSITFPEKLDIFSNALELIQGINNSSERIKLLLLLASSLEHRKDDSISIALDSVSLIDDESEKKSQLFKIAPYITRNTLSQSFEIIQEFFNELFIIECLIKLAGNFEERLAFYSGALDIIDNIEDLSKKAQALKMLASDLPEELVHRYMSITPDNDTEVLITTEIRIFRYLPEELQTVYLSILAEMPYVQEKQNIIYSLCDNFSAEFMPQLLEIISSIPNKYHVQSALDKVIPNLNEQHLPQVLSIVRDIQVEEADNNHMDRLTKRRCRVFSFLCLAKRFPHILPEALENIYAYNNGKHTIAEEIIKLAASYPEDRELKQKALNAARAVSDNSKQIQAFVSLVSVFPDVLSEAIVVIRDYEQDYQKRDALRELIPYLTEELLLEALTTARLIKDRFPVARALSKLAVYLPERLFPEVLATIETIGEEKKRAEILKELISILPRELLKKALEIISNIDSENDKNNILIELFPRIKNENVLLLEILEVINSFEDEITKANTLQKLVFYCSKVLSQAEAAAKAINNNYEKALALSELIPYLPHLLEEVISITNKITDLYSRVDALCKLLKYSEVVLDEIIRQIPEIDDYYSQQVLQNQLVSYIDTNDKASFSELLKLNLAIDKQENNSFHRDNKLFDIIPHLPKEIIEQNFETLVELKSFYILPIIAEYHPTVLLDNRLNYVISKSVWQYILVLEKLAPKMSKESILEALTIAANQNSIYLIAETLAILAPYFPTESLSEVLKNVEVVGEESETTQALLLAALAPQIIELFGNEYMYRLWLKILSSLSSMKREEILEQVDKLGYILLELGGSDVVEQAALAISDVNKWFS